eukprot:1259339-Pyramimonas_sp.AAC.1
MWAVQMKLATGGCEFSRPTTCVKLFDLLFDLHSAWKDGSLSEVKVNAIELEWVRGALRGAKIGNVSELASMSSHCLCSEIAAAAATRKRGHKKQAEHFGHSLQEASKLLTTLELAADAGPAGDDDSGEGHATEGVDQHLEDYESCALQQKMSAASKARAASMAAASASLDPSRSAEEHMFQAIVNVAFGNEVAAPLSQY